MARLRRKSRDERRAEVERAVAEALGQSEIGPHVTASVEPSDGRPPRYPAVGLHPGAIDGTVPHRSRLVTRD